MAEQYEELVAVDMAAVLNGEIKVVDCFMAFDMNDGRRVVGTVKVLDVSHVPGGWPEPRVRKIWLELPNGAEINEPVYAIEAGYMAPMGYRPPATFRYNRR